MLLATAPAFVADKLRVATTGDILPFSHDTDAGAFACFDTDTTLALRAVFGAGREVIPEERERLIRELRAGSFDAVAAGSMLIIRKWRELTSFTDRYYRSTARFVARKGFGFDPARATIASDWLEANLAGPATIRRNTGLQDLQGNLVAGLRLEAIFGDGQGSFA